MSFICHIHNYTEYNQQWNVFSAFNPFKCTHTWSSGQLTLQRPGSSLGYRCLAQGSHLSRGHFLPEPGCIIPLMVIPLMVLTIFMFTVIQIIKNGSPKNTNSSWYSKPVWFCFFHGTKKESYAIFQVFQWFVYVLFRPFSGQNEMVYWKELIQKNDSLTDPVL